MYLLLFISSNVIFNCWVKSITSDLRLFNLFRSEKWYNKHLFDLDYNDYITSFIVIYGINDVMRNVEIETK